MKTPLRERYTDEEFSKLEEVLALTDRVGLYLKLRWSASTWLASFDNQHQDHLTKYLDDPLEDMPLLINHQHFFLRVIAMWRLKIAR